MTLDLMLCCVTVIIIIIVYYARAAAQQRKTDKHKSKYNTQTLAYTKKRIPEEHTI
jgi:preprotein translocase subunit YajC